MYYALLKLKYGENLKNIHISWKLLGFLYKQIITNANDTKFIKRLLLKYCLSRNKVIVSVSLDTSSKFCFNLCFFKRYFDQV